jgi:hypothetical protein
MVAGIVTEEGKAGVGQNVSKDTRNTTRRRHPHGTAPCACPHARSSSSRIPCSSPHLSTSTSISNVPVSPSLQSRRPTAPHTRQSARTAPKSGPHAPTLREGSRARRVACDVAEPPRCVEEPPLTRPVAPIHAREAVAYLRITSGSKLAS